MSVVSFLAIGFLTITTGFHTDVDSNGSPFDYGLNWSSPHQEFNLYGYGILEAGYQGFSVSENGFAPHKPQFQTALLYGRMEYANRLRAVFEADAFDFKRGYWINGYLSADLTENHYLKAGRFATTFSTEFRQPKTKSLFIFRYHALSSLNRIGLAGNGWGIQMSGNLADLKYSFSLTSETPSDLIVMDHAPPEFQARFAYRFSEDLMYGLSLLYAAGRPEQNLSLSDHSGTLFSSLPVKGTTYGALLESEWFYGRWHTRSELFTLRFDESVTDGQPAWYYGSYAELGVHLSSSRSQAKHHLNGRLEVSQLYSVPDSYSGTSRVYTLVGGHTWHVSSRFTFTSNLILHYANPVSQNPDSRYEGEEFSFQLLGTLQILI